MRPVAISALTASAAGYMVTVLQCQCYYYGVSLSLSLVRGAAMRFWPLLAVPLASASDRDYFSSTSRLARLYELEAGLVTSLRTLDQSVFNSVSYFSRTTMCSHKNENIINTRASQLLSHGTSII